MDLRTEQLEAGLAKFQKLPRAYRMVAYPVIAAVVVSLYTYLFYLPAHDDLEAARSK